MVLYWDAWCVQVKEQMMASERMGTAETKRVTVAEAQRLAALLESATRLSEQTDG